MFAKAILKKLTACLLATIGLFSVQHGLAAAQQKDLRTYVLNAFEQSHDGWSSDEVLLSDERREAFISACRGLGIEESVASDDAICQMLLKLRKRGGLLPPATTKAPRDKRLDHLMPVAEVAARRLFDELGVHTDAILVSGAARELFDSAAEKILPRCDNYIVRKAALRLRKTRKLQPELLSRVTEWKREIVEYSVKQLSDEKSLIPHRPGVYIFRDSTGFLYIGQASNLRERLGKHLGGSDRPALAEYLDANFTNLQVELHVFASGSPGEKLTIRKAYESELIRTRKPRLNLAP